MKESFQSVKSFMNNFVIAHFPMNCSTNFVGKSLVPEVCDVVTFIVKELNVFKINFE